MRKHPVAGLLAPIGAIFLIASMVRSMVLTLWRGGIRWRDTFHPLGELREFHRDFRRDMAARWRASRPRVKSTRLDRE
jgi:hypothetical protein